MPRTDAPALHPGVNPEEAARFARSSASWWDPQGDFAPLHRMNPARLDFLIPQIIAHFARDSSQPDPLTGLTMLDVGCGGGLLTEPMARLGARVRGIDPVAEAVEAARSHADAAGLDIDYRVGTAARFTASAPHDVVFCMEVVEHLDDVDGHIEACAELLRPDGLLFVSTLNRTARSFLLAVVGAERVLRWVPRGTHDWRKFVRPEELCSTLRSHGLAPAASTGVVFDAFNARWELDERDLRVNYIQLAVRQAPDTAASGNRNPQTSGSSAPGSADNSIGESPRSHP